MVQLIELIGLIRRNDGQKSCGLRVSRFVLLGASIEHRARGKAHSAQSEGQRAWGTVPRAADHEQAVLSVCPDAK